MIIFAGLKEYRKAVKNHIRKYRFYKHIRDNKDESRALGYSEDNIRTVSVWADLVEMAFSEWNRVRPEDAKIVKMYLDLKRKRPGCNAAVKTSMKFYVSDSTVYAYVEQFTDTVSLLALQIGLLNPDKVKKAYKIPNLE